VRIGEREVQEGGTTALGLAALGGVRRDGSLLASDMDARV
jgi:hypothetical protein